MENNSKYKIDFKVLKRLLSYVKGEKLKVCVVVFFILLSSAVAAISSIFLQVLIDKYISPLLLESNPDFSGLLKAVITMACIYFVGAFSTLMYNRVVVNISHSVLKKIRDDMFSHMQTLPIKYFDSHAHGDIMSYYTNDTDTLRHMISHGLPHIFSALVTIVTIFFSMLYVSFWFTALVVLFVFITLKIASKYIKKSSKYFVKQQDAIGDVNGYVEEMINGQKVVKVFCYENKALEKFKVKNNELYNTATAATTHANVLSTFMMHIGYVLYFIIAVLGGWMALSEFPNFCLTGRNIFTLGMIASFLQLSINFINPISQISEQFNSIITALAGAKRIFEFMDVQSESDKGKIDLVYVEEKGGKIAETNKNTEKWAWKIPTDSGGVKYKILEGKVVFSNVNFGYSPEKIVLHDINIDAQPGQKIAFVGGTGAGKTTITNLINRFYDINSGSITYDGIDIKDIKKSALRKSLGVVLQDVNLFTGTIMDNIRYGRLEATDEECIAAAKLVSADGFIELLPEKYNTIISGNDSNLSQGQRQLISIARAAVADPPVMILDEATSSVDTRTEALIQMGMDALMNGRTVFVIAHRLSTIMNSDKIIVLKKGRIIEQGSHKNLLSQRGEYYSLYTESLKTE